MAHHMWVNCLSLGAVNVGHCIFKKKKREREKLILTTCNYYVKKKTKTFSTGGLKSQEP